MVKFKRDYYTSYTWDDGCVQDFVFRTGYSYECEWFNDYIKIYSIDKKVIIVLNKELQEKYLEIE